MHAQIKQTMEKIKDAKSLILLIINEVTNEFVANGLLSLGASPIVSRSKKDIHDLIKIIDVVVINLGTLDDDLIELAKYACQCANLLNKPVILDPVGAGASTYRTTANQHLIQQFRIDIIKGNASEIMSLTRKDVVSRGVDSHVNSCDAMKDAQWLAKHVGSTVVVSGEVDWVIDGEQVSKLSNGSPMMQRVTGTGCLLAAVIAAFHAVQPDKFTASVCAVTFYGLCGERAALKAGGSGSFKIHLLDEMSVFLDKIAHD